MGGEEAVGVRGVGGRRLWVCEGGEAVGGGGGWGYEGMGGGCGYEGSRL